MAVDRQLDEHLQGLVEKHARRGVLVDSSLLIVLLIGRHNRLALTRFPHTKRYQPDEFDILDRFVRLFDRIITTPHVLTEVSNLAGRLQAEAVCRFRRLFAQEVELYDERQCEARQLVRGDQFVRLGLTDAAIASIARDRLLVLTDDLALGGALQKVGIDVVNFTHLRPLAWG